MSEQTPADVLRLGAAKVRERGLARGAMQDSKGRVCAGYAMACSVESEGVFEAAMAVLAEHLGVPDTVGVVFWNDAASTGEHVARTMETAAARHEEQLIVERLIRESLGLELEPSQ